MNAYQQRLRQIARRQAVNLRQRQRLILNNARRQRPPGFFMIGLDNPAFLHAQIARKVGEVAP